MVREAQDKVIKIHEDIVDLKGIRRHFKEEVRRLIASHMSMLELDADRPAVRRERGLAALRLGAAAVAAEDLEAYVRSAPEAGDVPQLRAVLEDLRSKSRQRLN